MAVKYALANIPYTLDEVRLGSLVPDKRRPNQDAIGPVHNLRAKVDYKWRSQKNFKFVQQFEKGSAARLLLTKVLSFSAERNKDSNIELWSREGRVYELSQPEQLFRQMCRAKRTRDWLTKTNDDGSTIYFIIGYRTFFDASEADKAGGSSRLQGRATIPAGNTVSGSADVVSNTLDVEASADRFSKLNQEESFEIPGERIFSICFRRVRFSWLKSNDVDAAYLAKDTVWVATAVKRGHEAAHAQNIIEVQLQDDRGAENSTLIVDGVRKEEFYIPGDEDSDDIELDEGDDDDNKHAILPQARDRDEAGSLGSAQKSRTKAATHGAAAAAMRPVLGQHHRVETEARKSPRRAETSKKLITTIPKGKPSSHGDDSPRATAQERRTGVIPTAADVAATRVRQGQGNRSHPTNIRDLSQTLLRGGAGDYLGPERRQDTKPSPGQIATGGRYTGPPLSEQGKRVHIAGLPAGEQKPASSAAVGIVQSCETNSPRERSLEPSKEASATTVVSAGSSSTSISFNGPQVTTVVVPSVSAAQDFVGSLPPPLRHYVLATLGPLAREVLSGKEGALLRWTAHVAVSTLRADEIVKVLIYFQFEHRKRQQQHLEKKGAH